MVIFGASGDLTKRKLLPALYHLEQAGLLPEEFRHRRRRAPPLEDNSRGHARWHHRSSAASTRAKDKLDEFIKKISYLAMNFDDDNGYAALKGLLTSIDSDYGTRGNRLFYLATAPEYFADIVHRLGGHGMAKPEIRQRSRHY